MTAPAQVGAWALERELGRGGFGAVYRARHAVHGTPAALKLLLGGVDPDEVLRVEREAQALARLRHPGVVRLLDHGRHPRGWFLVMELVEGESLHERVRRGGPLPAAAAAQLVERLARACAHVHAAGLVHRDIKPENVIVDAGGLPRLIDFGLVRPLDPATPALTATGVLVGTPAFMAPEQVTGGGRAADARADVYGLGGVLYFALTGEAPFRGTNPVTVLTALLHQEPDPPAALVRSVPRAISDVCMRALAKAPDARFASSAALADALADALGAAAGAPRPPSGREPTAKDTPAPRRTATRRGRPAEARRAAWLVPGALALAAASAGAGALVTGRSPTPASPQAQSEPPPPPPPAPVEPAPIAPERVEPVTEAPPPAASEADAVVDRGKALLARGDNAGALDLFERALALDPRHAEATRRRAGLRFQRGDLTGARVDLDRAVALDPSSAWSWLHRALVRRALGDLPGALSDVERALEADPGYRLARTNLAVIREDLGDVAGAEAAFAEAIALAPTDGGAYASRGASRVQRGDLAGGRADLDRALELDPAHQVALYARGRLRAQTGDLRGAVDDWTRLLQHAPTFRNALIDRARARGRLGDAAGALADAARLLEANPRDAEALELRGTLRAGQGDPQGGLDDLTLAVQAEPRFALAWLNRGAARLAIGDRAGAASDLERALTLLPPGDPNRRRAEEALAALRGQ